MPTIYTCVYISIVFTSDVGLVAAGVAQIATELFMLPETITVGLPSLIVACIGGLLIHTRVPEAIPAIHPKP